MGMHLIVYASRECVSYRRTSLTGLSRGCVSRRHASHRRASLRGMHLLGEHLAGVRLMGVHLHIDSSSIAESNSAVRCTLAGFQPGPENPRHCPRSGTRVVPDLFQRWVCPTRHPAPGEHK